MCLLAKLSGSILSTTFVKTRCAPCTAVTQHLTRNCSACTSNISDKEPSGRTSKTVLKVHTAMWTLQKLAGVLSAREFVWWYNGHPEYANLPLDLSKIQSVAICGLGNVAVDCARILLQLPERLASTDIAEHALQQLKSSSVKEVHLIGRRGPVQVRKVLGCLRLIALNSGGGTHVAIVFGTIQETSGPLKQRSVGVKNQDLFAASHSSAAALLSHTSTAL